MTGERPLIVLASDHAGIGTEPFEGGRHAVRLEKIRRIENRPGQQSP